MGSQRPFHYANLPQLDTGIHIVVFPLPLRRNKIGRPIHSTTKCHSKCVIRPPLPLSVSARQIQRGRREGREAAAVVAGYPLRVQGCAKVMSPVTFSQPSQLSNCVMCRQFIFTRTTLRHDLSLIFAQILTRSVNWLSLIFQLLHVTFCYTCRHTFAYAAAECYRMHIVF